MSGFMSAEILARKFVVSGIVQGVGFRYFTMEAARRLQLTGYARNTAEGTVVVLAMGSLEQLGKLRTELEKGPAGSRVSEVREEEVDPDSKYAQSFTISYI